MNHTSYLTEAEVEALQGSGLKRETPYIIRGVTYTQFSISRYYGGAKYNGESFTYMPYTDELIRDDVLKWIDRLRSKKPAPAVSSQGELF